MIILVVADNKTVRAEHIVSVLNSDADILVHDETYGSVVELEQYLYPSLFSITPPIIHAKFILGNDADLITPTLLKKFIASPTVFLFEEMTLPTTLITTFKKSGAIVHIDEKKKITKTAPDLFANVASIITAKDKKAAWIAYRHVLETNSIEAIIGIMYWKVRDLASKGDREKYLKLYTGLLRAHAYAWQSGTPLELMIEKVILTR